MTTVVTARDRAEDVADDLGLPEDVKRLAGTLADRVYRECPHRADVLAAGAVYCAVKAGVAYGECEYRSQYVVADAAEVGQKSIYRAAESIQEAEGWLDAGGAV